MAITQVTLVDRNPIIQNLLWSPKADFPHPAEARVFYEDGTGDDWYAEDSGIMEALENGEDISGWAFIIGHLHGGWTDNIYPSESYNTKEEAIIAAIEYLNISEVPVNPYELIE